MGSANLPPPPTICNCLSMCLYIYDRRTTVKTTLSYTVDRPRCKHNFHYAYCLMMRNLLGKYPRYLFENFKCKISVHQFVKPTSLIPHHPMCFKKKQISLWLLCLRQKVNKQPLKTLLIQWYEYLWIICFSLCFRFVSPQVFLSLLLLKIMTWIRLDKSTKYKKNFWRTHDWFESSSKFRTSCQAVTAQVSV